MPNRPPFHHVVSTSRLLLGISLAGFALTANPWHSLTDLMRRLLRPLADNGIAGAAENALCFDGIFRPGERHDGDQFAF
jgi:hypothetical protein